MANLKYYRAEREEFKDAYALKLDDNQINLFFDKLKSRYKFKQTLIRKGRTGGGSCNQLRVRIAKETSLGVLVHEVAHAIQFKKIAYGLVNRRKFHTRKHTVIMRRIDDFVNKNKDMWIETQKKKWEKRNMVFQNRERQKHEQMLYQKTDQYKIERLEQKEKKLILKLKRVNNALKKVQRRIKYYKTKEVIVPLVL